jgi:hypothetical protein
MRALIPSWDDVMKTYRWLGWVLASVVVGVVTAIILYNFGFTRSEQINSYYGKLLHKRELNGVAGPHYWKNGRIFWADEHYVKSSNDFGSTSRSEVELPEFFDGPALFVSESILADKSNVYLKLGDKFHKVLESFRCWYICGSQLKSGDFVIGEYGNRIYNLNVLTGQTTLLLQKPPKARHFHVTAVDPFTDDIYTALGDALKEYYKLGDRITGIMRSQDGGTTWQWISKQKVVRGPKFYRQPTAIYFDKERIYFGTDSRPHGVFALDRENGTFTQVFSMSDLFHSWFTRIMKSKGSFWAVSRSFGKDHFGVLWWSGDGNKWTPVQLYKGTPVWLEIDEDHDFMSVGFYDSNSNVIVYDLPDAGQMAQWVSQGPAITLLDRLFRRRILTGRESDS